ncbi:hypothetical protein [Candidatus Nitrospira bockiana]
MKAHGMRSASVLAVALLLGPVGVAHAAGASSERQARVQEEHPSMQQEEPSRPRDRRGMQRRDWKQVSGEIERLKKVSVRGSRTEHLVALIRTEPGFPVFADLGPSHALKEWELRTGDEIAVRGPVGRVSGRRVLFAQQMRIYGETVSIARGGQVGDARGPRARVREVQGQVEAAKELKLRGSERKHLVARIKTDEGTRMAVDLGDRHDLQGLSIKDGQEIAAKGPVIRLGDKPLLVAQEVTADGKTAQIDRKKKSMMIAETGKPGGERGQPETIQGEVVVKGEVLKIDRDGFYVIKDPSGREVHLMVSEDMNRGFQVGDEIQAQVRDDGRVTRIEKLHGGGSSSMPSREGGQTGGSEQPSRQAPPDSTLR